MHPLGSGFSFTRFSVISVISEINEIVSLRGVKSSLLHRIAPVFVLIRHECVMGDGLRNAAAAVQVGKS